jgi:beta-N-acetylhexosaminidase
MGGQGAYIFGCAGLHLTPDETRFFTEANPWGFILFARNIENPAQVRSLTAELRGAVGRNVPVFIDQEGGRVARLRAPHWREWLAPLDQVAQNRRHAGRAMYLRYRLIADELWGLGIDGNCAPVVDIATPETHAILKNRCYGDDVVRVAEIAAAVASGLLDGGILPVVKHIPGHGRARTDSHLELPRVGEKLKTLRVTDFMAFEPFTEMPLAMTAHVVYEALDTENPATNSPAVIGMIREDIGFQGLLMSDDIAMGALSGRLSLRARAALRAGCDVALHCSGVLEEMEEVADATGRMGADAQARADRALTFRRMPAAIDIAACEAEFQALMTGQAENE